MNARLQVRDIDQFQGGLNLRSGGFHVAPDESPDMLNVHIDERGGFFTRQPWRRWNTADIVSGGAWEPKNAELAEYSDGTYSVFVTDVDTIYRAGTDGVFSDLSIPCNAVPHLADFTSWGDVTYIATGATADAIAGAPTKYTKGAGKAVLAAAGIANWNDDYTVPAGGVMPAAEVCEAHGSYLFAANTKEDAGTHPSRLRWSHPTGPGLAALPEDWAQNDYIDIEAGGGEITGLRSFRDHLLIFKTDSLWALYGYDRDSWQLIKVSRSIGAPSPAAVARSPQSIFFYSASGRGGIYAYQGDVPILISNAIRTAIQEVKYHYQVYCGWLNNYLVVSLPWVSNAVWENVLGQGTGTSAGTGVTTNKFTTTFAFDPMVGNGAWEAHRPAKGSTGPIVERSDILTGTGLLTVWGTDVGSQFVQSVDVEGCEDEIDDGVLEAFPSYFTTSWQFNGTPDLRKSWRRPRYVVRNPGQDLTLRVEVFWNYDETTPVRVGEIVLETSGRAYWRALGAGAPEGDGFDWDDGTQWGALERGSRLVRGAPLGVARAIQLRFAPNPSFAAVSWGIDEMSFKIIDRMVTT